MGNSVNEREKNIAISTLIRLHFKKNCERVYENRHISELNPTRIHDTILCFSLTRRPINGRIFSSCSARVHEYIFALHFMILKMVVD